MSGHLPSGDPAFTIAPVNLEIEAVTVTRAASGEQ
jgi:hypothetical protein